MVHLDLLGPKVRTKLAHQLEHHVYERAHATTLLQKAGEAPETAQALMGTLYLSKSGWLLLSVPNALGRGAFDALGEQGVELPIQGSTGQYNAHITIMSPDDIEQIGGPDRITERGHQFHYTTGPIKTVKPAGWADVERVWFIDVHSPELERLRRSYGLSSLPNNDKHRFHITIGVRKKKVLGRNTVQKDT